MKMYLKPESESLLSHLERNYRCVSSDSTRRDSGYGITSEEAS